MIPEAWPYPPSHLFGIFLLLFLMSAATTWAMRSLGHRFGWLSRPRPERWNQRRVALLGGVSIYLTFLAGYLLWMPKGIGTVFLVGGAGAMFVLGLIDDRRHLTPTAKLAVQIVAVAVVIAAGVQLQPTGSPVANVLITLLWFLGITNATNLLDHLDGLCAGVAMIACAFHMVLGWSGGEANGFLLALMLFAALAGFLLFNIHPASIFMGDSGSLPVGFLLAGITLIGPVERAESAFSLLLYPMLILIVPIFDTALVAIARKYSGRSISAGGVDHSSHRLVAIGLSERRSVILLYGIAALSGTMAFLLFQQGLNASVFVISLFFISMVLFGVYLSGVKVYDSARASSREGSLVFRLVRLFNRYGLLTLLDVLLVLTAYYGAYWLRFEVVQPRTWQFQLMVESSPILLAVSILCFYFFGLYRHDWRYVGLGDTMSIAKATVSSVVLTVLLLTYAYRFEGYSRSVFIIYGGILFLLLMAARFSSRLFPELLEAQPNHFKKALIYGAGDAGELVLRELKKNHDLERSVVGFLDDDASRLKTKIHGVPVLGELDRCEEVVRRFHVEEVIVSSRKIPEEKVERLLEKCRELKIDAVRASVNFEPLGGERK